MGILRTKLVGKFKFDFKTSELIISLKDLNKINLV